jgi:hypothetical protein
VDDLQSCSSGQPLRRAIGMTDGNKKHDILSGRVRREEIDDLVVEKSQPGGPDTLRVSGQV